MLAERLSQKASFESRTGGPPSDPPTNRWKGRTIMDGDPCWVS